MTECTRVYVDMVGDLFHAGHVALLRAARALGNQLVIGACRYVDEVIADAPDRLTREFLDEHRLSLVVHGDDVDPATTEVYRAAADSGMLRLVPRAGGISTTELIARVRSRSG